MTTETDFKSYQDLKVWQKAMDLTINCYELTATLPREEVYGLQAQMRRASVSIPSNIAEGWARETPASFIQFLRIAQGSTREIETQVIIVKRLGLAIEPKLSKLIGDCEEISKMLRSLIRSLEVRKANADS